MACPVPVSAEPVCGFSAISFVSASCVQLFPKFFETYTPFNVVLLAAGAPVSGASIWPACPSLKIFASSTIAYTKLWFCFGPVAMPSAVRPMRFCGANPGAASFLNVPGLPEEDRYRPFAGDSGLPFGKALAPARYPTTASTAPPRVRGFPPRLLTTTSVTKFANSHRP